MDGALLQRAGREALGVQGVDVAHQAVLNRQYLAVLQFDLARAAGRDGEDAGLHGAAPDVLQQCRVAPSPDDVLVDGAGLVGLQNPALDRHPVYPHDELRDRRSLRQWEDVGALHLPVALVEKLLLDAGDGHLVFDSHGDAVVADGEPGLLQWGWFGPRGRLRDDDAVGQGGAGTAQQ